MKALKSLVVFWTLVAVLELGVRSAEDAVPPADERPPLDYAIVVTGGELLEGVYADGHTHFLTRTLRLLGCRCVASLTVDDRREDLLRALRFATNQASVVLVTGGLGPTPNDITRETLAAFTGIPLHEHPDALSDLERRVGQPRDRLAANLRRQCLVPERGGCLPNPNGSAVGLIFDLAGTNRGGPGSWIIALPGPPRELQAMVRRHVVPFLQDHCGVRAFGHSLTLRFVGIGQSQIDQTVRDHVPLPPDVIVTSLFEGSRVDYTFALPGHGPEDLARLRQIEARLLDRLGDSCYADDGASLEEVVGRQITARKTSLVVVEAGTGGQLAAALAGLKEAGQFLAGACAATSAERLESLLNVPHDRRGRTGRDQAQALAEAAATWGRATWALAIGEVQADQAGQGVVWVALRTAEETCLFFSVPARDAREASRPGLVTAVLDGLRRALK